jgi:hypothetical protein
MRGRPTPIRIAVLLALVVLCTLMVYDSTASLLNDAPPSWAFVARAVVASADTTGVEIRIHGPTICVRQSWVCRVADPREAY